MVLGLSKFQPRAFCPIANDQLPTNPLMMLVVNRDGDIFKVRNPIRNCSEKSAAILSSEVAIKLVFTDSEMNQDGK